MMWPWSKGAKGTKLHPTTLEERLAALEAEQRTLKTEWISTLDQLRVIAGRIDASKRWLAEKAGAPPHTPPPIDAPAGTQEQIDAVPATAGADGGVGRPPTRKNLLASLLRKP